MEAVDWSDEAVVGVAVEAAATRVRAVGVKTDGAATPVPVPVPVRESDRRVILEALDRHPRRTSVILCIIVMGG